MDSSERIVAGCPRPMHGLRITYPSSLRKDENANVLGSPQGVRKSEQINSSERIVGCPRPMHGLSITYPELLSNQAGEAAASEGSSSIQSCPILISFGRGDYLLRVPLECQKIVERNVKKLPRDTRSYLKRHLVHFRQP